MKLILIAVLALSSMFAADKRWTYTAGYTVTGTSAKITLQLPAGAALKARPIAANVICGDACTLTQRRLGSTATATSATIIKSRTVSPTATASAFTASNSTGGTSWPSLPLTSGVWSLELEDIIIEAGENYSIDLAGSSQQMTLVIKWEEFR